MKIEKEGKKTNGEKMGKGKMIENIIMEKKTEGEKRVVPH